MKRILIDTNAYAAFKRNDPLALDIIRTSEYIGINIVVLGELYSGFKGGSKETKNRKELEQFLDSPRVQLIQMDEETAEFYANIHWDLVTTQVDRLKAFRNKSCVITQNFSD